MKEETLNEVLSKMYNNYNRYSDMRIQIQQKESEKDLAVIYAKREGYFQAIGELEKLIEEKEGLNHKL